MGLQRLPLDVVGYQEISEEFEFTIFSEFLREQQAAPSLIRVHWLEPSTKTLGYVRCRKAKQIPPGVTYVETDLQPSDIYDSKTLFWAYLKGTLCLILFLGLVAVSLWWLLLPEIRELFY